VLTGLAATLQAGSGPRNVYDVVILPQGSGSLRGVIGNQNLAESVPRSLITQVTKEQNSARSDLLYYAPAMLTSADGKNQQPALAVGAPISSHDQLYYLFPLNQQQQALQMVDTALFGAGLALVLLLAVIVSFVTRWVVVPLREGAQAATRLSAGDLGQRMPVRGTDDLAALANSFNEMAASLQDKLAELEELSQVQRQFVSDVSHELRTPLTTIRIAADILFEARNQLDASASRSAEVLQSQLERFEALLADLLEISRYDANVVSLDAESTNVCDLVRRAAADAEQLAAQRGSRIEFRLPPGPCVAEVDRRRIERVLRNLLGNAVEHGEGREVVVTVAGDRDAVAVTVRDHGVGLEPGEQHQVFDRFWRADPARARKTGGTGLGLAIAMEDTRLHGGWLQAWGEPGRGSVFRLTVPRTSGQDLAGSPLPLGPDEAEPDEVLARIALIPGAGAPADLRAAPAPRAAAHPDGNAQGQVNGDGTAPARPVPGTQADAHG
jgi:two-component system sensor histidine kinase MtrB